jgi:hypothetical protein
MLHPTSPSIFVFVFVLFPLQNLTKKAGRGSLPKLPAFARRSCSRLQTTAVI